MHSSNLPQPTLNTTSGSGSLICYRVSSTCMFSFTRWTFDRLSANPYFRLSFHSRSGLCLSSSSSSRSDSSKRLLLVPSSETPSASSESPGPTVDGRTRSREGTTSGQRPNQALWPKPVPCRRGEPGSSPGMIGSPKSCSLQSRRARSSSSYPFLRSSIRESTTPPFGLIYHQPLDSSCPSIHFIQRSQLSHELAISPDDCQWCTQRLVGKFQRHLYLCRSVPLSYQLIPDDERAVINKIL